MRDIKNVRPSYVKLKKKESILLNYEHCKVCEIYHRPNPPRIIQNIDLCLKLTGPSVSSQGLIHD